MTLEFTLNCIYLQTVWRNMSCFFPHQNPSCASIHPFMHYKNLKVNSRTLRIVLFNFLIAFSISSHFFLLWGSFIHLCIKKKKKVEWYCFMTILKSQGLSTIPNWILHQIWKSYFRQWTQTKLETKDTKTMLSIKLTGKDLIFTNRQAVVPEIGSNHQA